MDLKSAILIDYKSGTVVNPQHCYLVTASALTDEEWENLEDASDSELKSLALRGQCLTQNEVTLDNIQACLSQEFNSDTFNQIADLIRRTGRTITEPETETP